MDLKVLDVTKLESAIGAIHFWGFFLPAQSWFRAHDVCLTAVEIALLIES